MAESAESEFVPKVETPVSSPLSPATTSPMLLVSTPVPAVSEVAVPPTHVAVQPFYCFQPVSTVRVAQVKDAFEDSFTGLKSDAWSESGSQILGKLP